MIYVVVIVAIISLMLALAKYKKQEDSKEEKRSFEICEIYLETVRKYGINSDQAHAIKSFSDGKTLTLLRKIDRIRGEF